MRECYISVTSLVTISTVKFSKLDPVSNRHDNELNNLSHHIFLYIITKSSSSEKWNLPSPTPK